MSIDGNSLEVHRQPWRYSCLQSFSTRLGLCVQLAQCVEYCRDSLQGPLANGSTVLRDPARACQRSKSEVTGIIISWGASWLLQAGSSVSEAVRTSRCPIVA